MPNLVLNGVQYSYRDLLMIITENERLRAECEAIKNAISQARSVFDCEPAAKDVLDYVQELAKAKSRNEWERE